MANFLDYDPYAQSEIQGWVSHANNLFSPFYTPKTKAVKSTKKENPKNVSDKLKVLTLSTPLETFGLKGRSKEDLKQYPTDNTAGVILNYFKSKGLTDAQARGILGNVIAESNLNPTAINQQEKEAGLSGYGRGLVQWSNSRIKDFKKHVGIDIENASLKDQLDFMWYEMQQRPAFLKALYAATTIDQATDAVYRGYLNGSEKSLASPQMMQNVYSKAWSNLNLKAYDFQNELKARIKHGNKTIST